MPIWQDISKGKVDGSFERFATFFYSFVCSAVLGPTLCGQVQVFIVLCVYVCVCRTSGQDTLLICLQATAVDVLGAHYARCTASDKQLDTTSSGLEGLANSSESESESHSQSQFNFNCRMSGKWLCDVVKMGFGIACGQHWWPYDDTQLIIEK